VFLLQAIEQIDNTNDFFSLHLNTIRNGIITMSLYFEMGMFCMSGANAVFTLFGMNLNNEMEDSYLAFVLTCGLTLGLATFGFFAFVYGYQRINNNDETANDYARVKNYFA
jgi:hypothetical protein